MRGVQLSKRQRKVSIIPCFLLFKPILKSTLASIPYPELLAYAQSLSAFTSAPPNMPDLSQPGQLPPPLFFPPFPNEEKMRRGRLNAEAPLGILGETHSVGRRESIPFDLFNTFSFGYIISSVRFSQSHGCSSCWWDSIQTGYSYAATAV